MKRHDSFRIFKSCVGCTYCTYKMLTKQFYFYTNKVSEVSWDGSEYCDCQYKT